MELILDGVSKQYKDKTAVEHLDVTLESGVIGLLGANGAGKTTLMRMICGIIHAATIPLKRKGSSSTKHSFMRCSMK